MRALVVAVMCGLVGLAGCAGGSLSGVGGTSGSRQQTGTAGAKLTGAVHGGQNPISGAHVYLFAAASGAGGAGQAAYGGAGIAASASNASVSLLTKGSAQDGSGNWYVTTGGDGSFAISGDYTCAAGQQVYLYSVGGDPQMGTGTNAAAGLMAVLGNCPGTAGSTGDTFSSGMYVIVNEVSTVASAYAMAGFATDATHVGSSGTALAQVGIANAFANAANLVDLPSGTALATTPAGNGTVPQAEINTLANVLAACVNSNGAVTGGTNPTACYTLFNNAMSGGLSGTLPADTATAAINIAHNPAAGVAALYGLASGTPQFAGGLTGVPNDWTVEITISNSCISGPADVAIDGSGNAWFAGCMSVTGLSSLGAFLSPANGWGLSSNPNSANGYEAGAIAVDGSGGIWVVVTNGIFLAGHVVEMTDTGSLPYGIAGFSAPSQSSFPFTPFVPWNIAIDATGNAWTGEFFGVYGVAEFSASGTLLSGTQGFLGGASQINGMAFDGAGDLWVSGLISGVNASAVKLSSSGAVLSGANGYTGGNLGGLIAVDASGSVWSLGGSSVTKMSNTGSFLSGPNGYPLSPSITPYDIAIDGAGDAWLVGHGGMIEPLQLRDGVVFKDGRFSRLRRRRWVGRRVGWIWWGLCRVNWGGDTGDYADCGGAAGDADGGWEQ